MPHMIPQIEFMAAYHIETNCGTECVPADLVGDSATADSLSMYLEGKPRPDAEPERVEGWFARLSAPGYMDCTEWSGPFDTEKEAREHIADMFDVDPDTGEDIED